MFGVEGGGGVTGWDSFQRFYTRVVVQSGQSGGEGEGGFNNPHFNSQTFISAEGGGWVGGGGGWGGVSCARFSGPLYWQDFSLPPPGTGGTAVQIGKGMGVHIFF